MRKSLFFEADDGLDGSYANLAHDTNSQVTHAAISSSANFMQVGDSCAKCGMFVPDHATAHTHNDDGTGVNHFPEVVMTTGNSDDPYVAKRPLSTKMCWEWNWPTRWSTKFGRFNLCSISMDIAWKGDHSPSLHVLVVLCNIVLLDFGYYNLHHEDCEANCIKEIATGHEDE